MGILGLSLITVALFDLYQLRDVDSLLFFWDDGDVRIRRRVQLDHEWKVDPPDDRAGQYADRSPHALPDRAAPRRLPLAILPLAAAAVLSLSVAWADCRLANAGRTGARLIHEKYGLGSNTVWFQGHWGFQYYMQQLRAKPLDVANLRLTANDVVAVPTTNTNVYPMAAQWVVRDVFEVPSGGWLATMNPGIGAGFYADVFGPLPFAIGSIPPERFTVYAPGPAH